MRKIIAVIPVACLLLLTACGSTTNVKVQGVTTVSKGQELVDLKRALDEGAISQQEYDKLQTIILKRKD
ncbi:hypothetical protein [Chitinilyticum piscinae]|uniref:SHOCT domain-containing protein n=1 Tax=Chitinilyticum piscinae TaxID=2866724 RepID=A0A8J7FHN9_9NEIS|nr:hypothetical protein [Chitinilyticum piscinae]MBE9607952.1 hypothetical protein [Chitinilyticum piscinae]